MLICGDDYSWEANCAANAKTNGVDLRETASESQAPGPMIAKGVILDQSAGRVVRLPDAPVSESRLLPASDNDGVIKSFVLPGNKTGVVSSIFVNVLLTD